MEKRSFLQSGPLPHAVTLTEYASDAGSFIILGSRILPLHPVMWTVLLAFTFLDFISSVEDILSLPKGDANKNKSRVHHLCSNIILNKRSLLSTGLTS